MRMIRWNSGADGKVRTGEGKRYRAMRRDQLGVPRGLFVFGVFLRLNAMRCTHLRPGDISAGALYLEMLNRR